METTLLQQGTGNNKTLKMRALPGGAILNYSKKENPIIQQGVNYDNLVQKGAVPVGATQAAAFMQLPKCKNGNKVQSNKKLEKNNSKKSKKGNQEKSDKKNKKPKHVNFKNDDNENYGYEVTDQNNNDKSYDGDDDCIYIGATHYINLLSSDDEDANNKTSLYQKPYVTEERVENIRIYNKNNDKDYEKTESGENEKGNENGYSDENDNVDEIETDESISGDKNENDEFINEDENKNENGNKNGDESVFGVDISSDENKNEIDDENNNFNGYAVLEQLQINNEPNNGIATDDKPNPNIVNFPESMDEQDEKDRTKDKFLAIERNTNADAACSPSNTEHHNRTMGENIEELVTEICDEDPTLKNIENRFFMEESKCNVGEKSSLFKDLNNIELQTDSYEDLKTAFGNGSAKENVCSEAEKSDDGPAEVGTVASEEVNNGTDDVTDVAVESDLSSNFFAENNCEEIFPELGFLSNLENNLSDINAMERELDHALEEIDAKAKVQSEKIQILEDVRITLPIDTDDLKKVDTETKNNLEPNVVWSATHGLNRNIFEQKASNCHAEKSKVSETEIVTKDTAASLERESDGSESEDGSGSSSSGSSSSDGDSSDESSSSEESELESGELRDTDEETNADEEPVQKKLKSEG